LQHCVKIHSQDISPALTHNTTKVIDEAQLDSFLTDIADGIMIVQKIWHSISTDHSKKNHQFIAKIDMEKDL